MEFYEVIKNRYSCRKFSNKQIDKDKLNRILEAGRIAPTAKNTQEQRIYVLSTEEKLKLFDTVCPCRYNAPIVLIVAFDKDITFTYPGGKKKGGDEDATIVATHMMLAAKNEGIDSCWLNRIDPEEVREKFGLPENEEVVMALDLGIADSDAKPSENHLKRFDLDKTVKFL